MIDVNIEALRKGYDLGAANKLGGGLMAETPCSDHSKADEILANYPAEEPALIQVLQDVHRAYNYLPCDVLERVADALDVPLAKVFSVSTFYKAFSLEPQGDTIVKVCTGTACHIRGAGQLVEELERQARHRARRDHRRPQVHGQDGQLCGCLRHGAGHDRRREVLGQCQSPLGWPSTWPREATMRIESRDQFEALRTQAREIDANRRQQVLVCCGTGCLASGAKTVAEAFATEIAKRSIDADVNLFVKSTGCHGFCERGPLVVVQPMGVLYTKVKPKRVEEIVEKTLLGGEVITNLLYKEPVSNQRIEKYEEVPFYKNQVRVAMRNIGRIDPTSILDAIAEGAYSGLAKALFDLSSRRSHR